MGPTKVDDPTHTELAHFTLKLPRNQKSVVTYSWVELGPQERHSLNLDNAARTDPARSYTSTQVKLNKAFHLTDQRNRPVWSGALFFARKCEDRNLPDEERRAKEYEYFVLTRDPEFDPDDPTETARTPKIDGSYLVSATAGQGQDLRPAVHFTFNTTGGNLFRDITRKNIPEGGGTPDSQTYRHLAIILDGLIMSAPTINSEISTQGPNLRQLHAEGSHQPRQHPARRPPAGHAQAAAGERKHHGRHARSGHHRAPASGPCCWRSSPCSRS